MESELQAALDKAGIDFDKMAAWCGPVIAKLVDKGMAPEAAAEKATMAYIKGRMNFLAELAEGKTAQAQAVREQLFEDAWNELRGEA